MTSDRDTWVNVWWPLIFIGLVTVMSVGTIVFAYDPH